jgi:hypothetical protein
MELPPRRLWSKEELVPSFAGHEADFGAKLKSDDDYPDYAPLAKAVASAR